MSNTITISFDPNNLVDCEKTADQIGFILRKYHGDAVMTRIFLAAIPSKRHLQKHANLRLMVNYKRSKLSAKQFAKTLAEKNKSLPLDRRRGGGSTNAETLEKQIRREKKRMQRDEHYRELVEHYATPPSERTFRNKTSGDILK